MIQTRAFGLSSAGPALSLGLGPFQLYYTSYDTGAGILTNIEQ